MDRGIQIRVYSTSLLVLFILYGTCHSFNVACMVTEIEDGDTVVISDDNIHMYKVDLYGIDAPELKQDGGMYGAELLSRMVSGKKVLVTVVGKDKRNRPHIKMAVQGASVNGAMVKAGYAWVVPTGCLEPECKRWKTYQGVASKKKHGLWRYQNSVEPWVWRGKYGETVPQYPGEVTITRNLKSVENSLGQKKVAERKERSKSFVRRGKTSINAYEYRPQKDKYIWHHLRKRQTKIQ